MKLSNKVYDILKWIVMIVIPAILTFLSLIGKTLDINAMDVVVIIGSGFNTMLGTILGISSANYNKGE